MHWELTKPTRKRVSHLRISFPMLILTAVWLALLISNCTRPEEKEVKPELTTQSPDAQKQATADNQDEIFTVADEMPRLRGCEEAPPQPGRLDACTEKKVLDFIANNLHYPKSAREAALEGRVIAQFVVDKDGTISNVTILRDIGGGCGEEVVRVIHLMNERAMQWIPARQDGQPVRFKYILPVVFKL